MKTKFAHQYSIAVAKLGKHRSELGLFGTTGDRMIVLVPDQPGRKITRRMRDESLGNYEDPIQHDSTSA